MKSLVCYKPCHWSFNLFFRLNSIQQQMTHTDKNDIGIEIEPPDEK